MPIIAKTTANCSTLRLQLDSISWSSMIRRRKTPRPTISPPTILYRLLSFKVRTLAISNLIRIDHTKVWEPVQLSGSGAVVFGNVFSECLDDRVSEG